MVSASILFSSLNLVYRCLKSDPDEILTSIISQVSSHIPHPLSYFCISDLALSLNLDLFLRISEIVMLAMLSLTIEMARLSIFLLAS